MDKPATATFVEEHVAFTQSIQRRHMHSIPRSDCRQHTLAQRTKPENVLSREVVAVEDLRSWNDRTAHFLHGIPNHVRAEDLVFTITVSQYCKLKRHRS